MTPSDGSRARSSVLHRVSPAVKLAATLVVLAAIALMPRRPHLAYVLPAVVLLAVAVVAHVSPRFVWRRLIVVEPLIAGIAVLSFLRPALAPVVLAAVIKSNLCLLALLVLTWTTPFHEILLVFRRLRVPAPMVTTLALMARYLPVLADESRRMQRARASRTFVRRRHFEWHTLSMIAARLFARSAGRAERIYLAMCARGWK